MPQQPADAEHEPGTAERWKQEVDALVENEARAVIEAPWPDAEETGAGVLAGEPTRRHVEVLESRSPFRSVPTPELPPLDPGPPPDPKGRTFLDAVMLGVGAAFDFHAGLKKQAPRWMQRSGLEWFFRMCTEPKRLWRRYMRNNPRFVGLMLRHALVTGTF